MQYEKDYGIVRILTYSKATTPLGGLIRTFKKVAKLFAMIEKFAPATHLSYMCRLFT
jgi:hypothetical protein